MRNVFWDGIPSPELRIRPPGSATTVRYGLATDRRGGTGSLFHAPYDPAHEALHLPAYLLLCVDRKGAPVELAALIREQAPHAKAVPAEVVLPPGHPQVVEGPEPAEDQAQVVPALFLEGATEPEVDALVKQGELLSALRLSADETVECLGPTLVRPRYLKRLPRIVLARRSEIADNTDIGVSMGRLLEQFLQRFSAPGHSLAELCIATGYLFHHGLLHTLSLLQNTAVRRVQLLFSGKTDGLTARALTAAFGQALRDDFDAEPSEALWNQLLAAAQSGRLEVRVYTDAFLHAKLFIGHDGLDDLQKLRSGYAVVGSSNVSGPGLRSGGNLELDVSIDGRDRTTMLYEWFQHRWLESSLPEPSLLEVLQGVRPVAAPSFQTEGLSDVWTAGVKGRLVPSAHHLALLIHLYEPQLTGLDLPSEDAFPRKDGRQIEPTPEQCDGVLGLAQRLRRVRIAFLADSVGLGKTVTALGLVDYLARNGLADKAALIAPRKLWEQWEADARRAAIPAAQLKRVNRHTLERASPEDAQATLAPYDLLVVEEAHESLRQRQNRLWQHLRAHLRRNPTCRLLLVSATPWNNRREDIFNYLLLAWQDGAALREHYPALDAAPLAAELSTFKVPPQTGARVFERLPQDRYRTVFDAVFVQRTRSTLEQLGRTLHFPERRLSVEQTPSSEAHDQLYQELSALLGALHVPYREPFHALLVAAGLLGISNPSMAAIDPDLEALAPQLQQSLEKLAHRGVVLAKTVRDPVHGPVVYFRRR